MDRHRNGGYWGDHTCSRRTHRCAIPGRLRSYRSRLLFFSPHHQHRAEPGTRPGRNSTTWCLAPRRSPSGAFKVLNPVRLPTTKTASPSWNRRHSEPRLRLILVGASGSSARDSLPNPVLSNSVPNYRFNTGGFLVGGDYSRNESFLTGLFGGYEGTEANYANSGRTQSNAFRFGIYGS